MTEVSFVRVLWRRRKVPKREFFLQSFGKKEKKCALIEQCGEKVRESDAERFGRKRKEEEEALLIILQRGKELEGRGRERQGKKSWYQRDDEFNRKRITEPEVRRKVPLEFEMEGRNGRGLQVRHSTTRPHGNYFCFHGECSQAGAEGSGSPKTSTLKRKKKQLKSLLSRMTPKVSHAPITRCGLIVTEHLHNLLQHHLF